MVVVADIPAEHLADLFAAAAVVVVAAVAASSGFVPFGVAVDCHIALVALVVDELVVVAAAGGLVAVVVAFAVDTLAVVVAHYLAKPQNASCTDCIVLLPPLQQRQVQWAVGKRQKGHEPELADVEWQIHVSVRQPWFCGPEETDWGWMSWTYVVSLVLASPCQLEQPSDLLA